MHDRSRSGNVHDRRWNSHYENDIQYSLQMSQWLLKAIGMWPLDCTRSSRIISVILTTICLSSILFIVLPCCHHFFFVEKSLQAKVKMLGPAGFCVSSTIKYCFLGLKGTAFEKCIQHVKKDWRTVRDEAHRTIMLKYVRISRNLIAVCAVFLYTGGMSYHTVMQFLSKEKNGENHTLKPLAYPGYDSFFDTQTSPTYEIVFVVHCFAAMVMYSVTTAAYSMAAVSVTHVCGQVQIQIARLRELVERLQRMRDDEPDPLAVIVHDHVEVLRFTKNIEEAMREICFTEIVECTFNMCLLEYYCLMGWGNSDIISLLTFFMLLISFTFNIFIFCYIGEVLSEQCSQIGTASYEIDWYDLPSEKAYDLILLNVISQYPTKLTAGKIIELSLNTFSSVAKTSVVYLNLLRTVTNW